MSRHQISYHVGCFKSSDEVTAGRTCAQCRWRKVRCDKRLGTCSNCDRLGLSCSSSLHPRQSSLVAAKEESAHATSNALNGLNVANATKPRRIRNSRACVACRDKKIRCSGAFPSCSACRDKGLTCVYPTLKRPLKKKKDDSRDVEDQAHAPGNMDPTANATNSSEPPSCLGPTSTAPQLTHSTIISNACTGEMALPSQTASGNDKMRDSLINFFFDKIYPLPSYAFLHPPTTKRRCRVGNSKHADLAAALCAVSAIHLGGEVLRRQAAEWAGAAEQKIWLHLESPTIPRLQTLLLIIHHHMETSRFQRAFMLTATAARFATALRLNHERPDLEPVAREVRRRIIWSTRIIERYFSVGLAEFELLPFEAIYINLPNSEEEFDPTPMGSADFADPVAEEGGAYSFIVRLETARQDIMKLTRSVAILEDPLPSLDELLQHHDRTLGDIGSAMGLGGSGNSPTSEVIHAPSGRWLPRRMLMFASLHQAYCDLYRILLGGYPEAAPAIVLRDVRPALLEAAEQQCISHATSIIEILTSLNQRSSQDHLLEFDTAICAYHATRLILFISRFGKGVNLPSPEFAASRADLCLAALRRFFPKSALVAPLIQELEQSLSLFRKQQQQQQQRSQYHSIHQQQARPPVATHGQRLSEAALVRQRLAVHSLLRQADFSSDDVGDNDDGYEANTSTMQVPGSSSVAVQPQEQSTGLLSDAPVTTLNGKGDWEAASATANLDTYSQALDATWSSPGHKHSLAGDWPQSTSPLFPDMGGGAANPDVQHSFFAWFGPQDWEWLIDPSNNDEGLGAAGSS